MFLLYCFRTLRCLVFPMTLVVNMSDPMTEVRVNSQQQLEQMQEAAKAQLAKIEEKAAERQRQMEAHAAAKHQAMVAKQKADAEHRAKVVKQAAMPARRLPPQADQICANIASRQPVKPKGSVAAVDPKATAVKPKGSVAAVGPKATDVKAKGSSAAVSPKPTAVKAKATGGIPDKAKAKANIQAVIPSRYAAAKASQPKIELPIPDEEARADAAQICSRVFGQKACRVFSFIFRHFLFRHFVFRYFIYRGFCL